MAVALQIWECKTIFFILFYVSRPTFLSVPNGPKHWWFFFPLVSTVIIIKNICCSTQLTLCILCALRECNLSFVVGPCLEIECLSKPSFAFCEGLWCKGLFCVFLPGTYGTELMKRAPSREAGFCMGLQGTALQKQCLCSLIFVTW